MFLCDITVRICITCISYADIIHVVQNRQNRIYLIERKMRRDVENVQFVSGYMKTPFAVGLQLFPWLKILIKSSRADVLCLHPEMDGG